MQALDFEGSLVGVITLDFCFPCQVIWFDSHESTQLPQAQSSKSSKPSIHARPTSRNALPYCRSPIAILDMEAVGKTVREFSDAQARRSTVDVDKLADALLMRAPREDRAPLFASPPRLGGDLGLDLVAAGVAVVAALLR
jgi:hypothetical protein